MEKDEKPIKVFRSVMEDAPPNPFYILLCLPVALFCMVCSFFYDIDKESFDF